MIYKTICNTVTYYVHYNSYSWVYFPFLFLFFFSSVISLRIPFFPPLITLHILHSPSLQMFPSFLIHISHTTGYFTFYYSCSLVSSLPSHFLAFRQVRKDLQQQGMKPYEEELPLAPPGDGPSCFYRFNKSPSNSEWLLVTCILDICSAWAV